MSSIPTRKQVNDRYTLRDAVCKLAKRNGWLIDLNPYDKPGSPDFLLAHPLKGIIFAHILNEYQKYLLPQKSWGKALQPTGVYHIWRPSDWDKGIIQKKLLGGLS